MVGIIGSKCQSLCVRKWNNFGKEYQEVFKSLIKKVSKKTKIGQNFLK